MEEFGWLLKSSENIRGQIEWFFRNLIPEVVNRVAPVMVISESVSQSVFSDNEWSQYIMKKLYVSHKNHQNGCHASQINGFNSAFLEADTSK